MTLSARSNRHRAFALPVVAIAGASMLFAACSSTTKASSVPPPAAGGSPTTSNGSTTDNASVTVSAASVPGLGTVLVDGNGRTLYVLASEQGGTVTCTTATGCTAVWPALVLPSGMSHGIAGSGVQASLLGTVKGPAGDTRVTYRGWPLYTFAEDSAAGSAKGQDLTDTWGLWWVLSPSGNPIKTTASTPTTAPSTPSTTAPQSGGAGF